MQNIISILGFFTLFIMIANPSKSIGASYDEITAQASEDLKYFVGKTGTYKEFRDGRETPVAAISCKVDLKLDPLNKDFAAFVFSMAPAEGQKLVPFIEFYIANSGKKENANRIIFDDGSSAYAPISKINDKAPICGTWGSTQKPMIEVFSEVVTSDDENSVTFVLDYTCSLLNHEKQSLVRICQF